MTIGDARASSGVRAPRFLEHPLVQLTLVRVREFTREPEAVFWALFFPILMTAGLGVAFRSRPAEVLKVAAASPSIAQALRQEPTLDVAELQPAAGEQLLRTGKVALLVEPGAAGAVVYRYDDTNPEGRTARMLADRAVQRAAGRADPVPATDGIIREPGSRYVDFLVPGLVGMGIMSNALWGLGFSIVDSRRRKLPKRLIATPMSRTYYLLSYLVWRLIVLVVEVGVPIGFGALAFGVPVRGRLFDLAVIFGSSSCAAKVLFVKAVAVSARRNAVAPFLGRTARRCHAGDDQGRACAAAPRKTRRRRRRSARSPGGAAALPRRRSSPGRSPAPPRPPGRAPPRDARRRTRPLAPRLRPGAASRWRRPASRRARASPRRAPAAPPAVRSAPARRGRAQVRQVRVTADGAARRAGSVEQDGVKGAIRLPAQRVRGDHPSVEPERGEVCLEPRETRARARRARSPPRRPPPAAASCRRAPRRDRARACPRTSPSSRAGSAAAASCTHHAPSPRSPAAPRPRPGGAAAARRSAGLARRAARPSSVADPGSRSVRSSGGATQAPAPRIAAAAASPQAAVTGRPSQSGSAAPRAPPPRPPAPRRPAARQRSPAPRDAPLGMRARKPHRTIDRRMGGHAVEVELGRRQPERVTRRRAAGSCADAARARRRCAPDGAARPGRASERARARNGAVPRAPTRRTGRTACARRRTRRNQRGGGGAGGVPGALTVTPGRRPAIGIGALAQARRRSDRAAPRRGALGANVSSARIRFSGYAGASRTACPSRPRQRVDDEQGRRGRIALRRRDHDPAWPQPEILRSALGEPQRIARDLARRAGRRSTRGCG